jgi:peptide/nickel transport system ATP-binding protein
MTIQRIHTDPMLMQVSILRVGFDTQQGPVTVVDGVSIDIHASEIVAIVGESGCGKSVTALSLTRLTGTNSNILTGQVNFLGQDLSQLPIEQLRAIRGRDISYIFQEPMTSLNPVYTVGEQIMEPLMLHMKMTRSQAKNEAVRLLELVNIPSPHMRVSEYPHQLSGGMRQRVMIAMAIACRPKLLIADEPTTALDVTVQAQILELLQELQREFGMAILLITHDMGVVAEFSHKVVVMYAGRIAETGKTEEIFSDPRHPYTKALLNSIPPIDYEVDRLPTLSGTVPSPTNMPKGCRFYDRCVDAKPACKIQLVDPIFITPDHAVACIKDFDYQMPMESRS